MDKVPASPAAAVADIGDGASIGIARFGVAHGFASSLIIALRDQGSAGLTVYCNGLGQPGFPTAHLLADNHQICHLVTCRVAALLPDGAVVNLGAGLPARVANFLRGRPCKKAGKTECERNCLTRPAPANEAWTPRSLPGCAACAG